MTTRKRITIDTAEKICKMLQDGSFKDTEIAKELKCSVSCVREIKYRHTWKEVSNKYTFNYNRGNKHIQTYKSTITRDQAIQICEYLQEGIISIPNIAKLVGCGNAVVRNIKYGMSWKDVSKDYNFKIRHMYHNGKTYPSYFDDDIVKTICDYIEEGKSPREISKLTGMTREYIAKLKTKRIRPEITGKYDFNKVPSKKEIDTLVNLWDKYVLNSSDNTEADYEIKKYMILGYKLAKSNAKVDIPSDYNDIKTLED